MFRSLVSLVLGLALSACSLYAAETDRGEAAPPLARDRYATEQVGGFDSGPSAAYAFAPSPFHTEAYARIDESEFRNTAQHPLSTFAVDVDTASYSNVRRFLREGRLPPADAVRVEELVNYFPYGYEPPANGAPVAVHAEVTGCPWQPAHRLVRIGLAAKALPRGQRPPASLVFLIDVSGSMAMGNKLPLVKSALRLLVEQLDEADSVAIVVYAGASGLVLPATSGDRKQEILAALERLEAGGSTHGSAGINLAYQVAAQAARPGAASRVVLATDGDFNVGVTSEGELTRLIEEKARGGTFLSVLGFGTGNLKDSTMERLADRGNGSYAYVDTLGEARKALVEQLTGTLITVAKDVKIQVEFNPAQAASYRLVGYESRLLAPEDFRDDTKDAGEIGAGHTVTALYEIVPVGAQGGGRSVDPLRYQTPRGAAPDAASGELLTVKLRYQEPEGGASMPLELAVVDPGGEFAAASADGRFAAAVAAFGLLLRESPHRGQASFDSVIAIAEAAGAASGDAYRREFLELARLARDLRGGPRPVGRPGPLE